MPLCSNRPEGLGPISHLYSHSLTSCFLDTILIPLCTWLYFLSLGATYLLSVGSKNHERSRVARGIGSRAFENIELNDLNMTTSRKPKLLKTRGKLCLVFTILYYLLLPAQFLMCVLEIARLSLARLGIGLLPFIFIALLMAGSLRYLRIIKRRALRWRWMNLGLWIALAVTNSVKLSQEIKEGIDTRKGTKYPMVDEITDVSVMIGVYVALGILEIWFEMRTTDLEG
ncbi:hypothetical protein MMC07_008679 [Pseudocyphellaria aurata]|nr:hypothetical protein [Pseudocyphellaria aurata]